MQIIMFVKQKKIIGDSTDSFRKRVTIYFHTYFIAFIIFCSCVTFICMGNQLANRKLDGWGEISVFRIIYIVIYNCVKLK